MWPLRSLFTPCSLNKVARKLMNPPKLAKMASGGSGDSKKLIEIDGSIMEGGGQILRMSSVFSVLLQQPIRVKNIRAGRSKPGLRPQHLEGLRLMAEICQGKLVSGEVGSTQIELHPGPIKTGDYLADPGTAGSICMMLQTVLPCALFAPGDMRIRLRGGTNAEFAPQIDFYLEVFKPTLKKIGIEFELEDIRRGYYPKGGGETLLRTKPMKEGFESFELVHRGEIKEVRGRAWVAGVLPYRLANSAVRGAQEVLKQSLPAGVPIKISSEKEPANHAFGNGSGIQLIAETSTGALLAGDGLGKRGMGDEARGFGHIAAEALCKNIAEGGVVDDHMQDQLIVFMALAKGSSKVLAGPLTLHTKTAIHIAELLTEAKFTVTEEKEGTVMICCNGIGYQ